MDLTMPQSIFRLVLNNMELEDELEQMKATTTVISETISKKELEIALHQKGMWEVGYKGLQDENKKLQKELKQLRVAYQQLNLEHKQLKVQDSPQYLEMKDKYEKSVEECERFEKEYHNVCEKVKLNESKATQSTVLQSINCSQYIKSKVNKIMNDNSIGRIQQDFKDWITPQLIKQIQNLRLQIDKVITAHNLLSKQHEDSLKMIQSQHDQIKKFKQVQENLTFLGQWQEKYNQATKEIYNLSKEILRKTEVYDPDNPTKDKAKQFKYKEFINFVKFILLKVRTIQQVIDRSQL